MLAVYSRFAVTIALVTGMATLIGGCQGEPEVGVVRGVVTHRGKPLTGGTITMEGGEPRIALMAPISENGTYAMQTHEADGLPPGSYKVAISSQRIAEGDLVVLATDAAKARPAAPTVPQKYHSVETSGLTAEVAAGDNPPYNFDLK